MTRARQALLAVALSSFGVGCSSDPDPRRYPPSPTGLDESFLDRDADPCTDFYQFACGTWLREHPSQPGYVEARYFNSDQRHSDYFEHVLFGDIETEVDVTDARAYFDACMAVRGGNASDLSAPSGLLAEIGRANTAADVATVVAHLHLAGVSALFYADPEPDPGDATVRIVELWGGGWSLPSLENYADGSALTQPYQDHMVALAALFTGATVAPKVVWNLESRIALAASAPSTFRDPGATYNPMDESALEAEAPSFDWASYFSERGFGVPGRVSLVEPSFFTALETLLHDAPIADLRSYLTWRTLEVVGDAAARSTINEENHFHHLVVDGRVTEYSDEYSCTRAARQLFGTTLAHVYANAFVAPGTVPEVSKLVAEVRATLRADLGEVSWLDDATRQRLIGKLDAMNAKVGYPSDWDAGSQVSIARSNSFLEDVLFAARFFSQKQAKYLSSPVDRSEWLLSPDTTNAVYSASRNDITLPVALFEDPFYSPDWPRSSRYAAIGSVMGHEMTHGFDDYGGRFDGSGTLANLWSDATNGEFHTRAACLVDQYDAYEPLPGLHVNGAETLGENIADLGGLKLAHAAFVAAGRSASPSALFDPEQAFFMSYAQLWCENDSQQVLEQGLATDAHSPAQYRVNGVVRNVPEFAKAFNCPKNAELAPADRCDIW